MWPCDPTPSLTPLCTRLISRIWRQATETSWWILHFKWIFCLCRVFYLGKRTIPIRSDWIESSWSLKNFKTLKFVCFFLFVWIYKKMGTRDQEKKICRNNSPLSFENYQLTLVLKNVFKFHYDEQNLRPVDFKGQLFYYFISMKELLLCRSLWKS